MRDEALITPGQLLLTVPQVARLLGMSPKAIYHRAERGQRNRLGIYGWRT